MLRQTTRPRPVGWQLLRVRDDHNGAVCRVEEARRDAAEQRRPPSAETAGAYDDRGGVPLPRHPEDGVRHASLRFDRSWLGIEPALPRQLRASGKEGLAGGPTSKQLSLWSGAQRTDRRFRAA